MSRSVEEMARELKCCGIKLCRGAVYTDDTLIGFMCLECGVGYDLAEITAKFKEMEADNE